VKLAAKEGRTSKKAAKEAAKEVEAKKAAKQVDDHHTPAKTRAYLQSQVTAEKEGSSNTSEKSPSKNAAPKVSGEQQVPSSVGRAKSPGKHAAHKGCIPLYELARAPALAITLANSCVRPPLFPIPILALAALAHTACHELAHTVSVVERARYTGSGTIPKVERSHPVNTWVTTLRFWDLPFCCCGRVQRHVLPCFFSHAMNCGCYGNTIHLNTSYRGEVPPQLTRAWSKRKRAHPQLTQAWSKRKTVPLQKCYSRR
jgi:hypothetical protein